MAVECSVLNKTSISLPPRLKKHCGRGGEKNEKGNRREGVL